MKITILLCLGVIVLICACWWTMGYDFNRRGEVAFWCYFVSIVGCVFTCLFKHHNK